MSNIVYIPLSPNYFCNLPLSFAKQSFNISYPSWVRYLVINTDSTVFGYQVCPEKINDEYVCKEGWQVKLGSFENLTNLSIPLLYTLNWV